MRCSCIDESGKTQGLIVYKETEIPSNQIKRFWVYVNGGVEVFNAAV